MICSFNRLVKTKHIHVRDFVLRKVEATGKIVDKGKLGANCDGLFKIVRVIKHGTFELEDIQGNKLPRPWNGDHLKRYFI